jgi:hypothetical protein
VLNNAGMLLTCRTVDRLPVMDAIVQAPLALTVAVDIDAIMTPSPAGELVPAPLAHLTLTVCPTEDATALGFSIWHGIADGFSALHFLMTLSQHYQGLAPPEAPVFLPAVAGGSTAPDLAGEDFDLECYTHTHRRGAETEELERVDFRLSGAQLAGIRAKVEEGYHAAGHAGRLSQQDCLVALLARCMTLADPDGPPIERAHTLLNVRAAPTPRRGSRAELTGPCRSVAPRTCPRTWRGTA